MRLIIFDIDGVLMRGSQPLPHAVEAMRQLRAEGYLISFLTNNSSRTPETYASRLNNVGIEASIDEIMSSAIATALYLKKESPNGAKILVLGEEGITKALNDEGFEIIGYDNPAPVDYVVVGMDRGFNYEKLYRAQKEIWFNKAKLIATNRDPIYPTENDGVRPGGGVMVAAVETCTRQTAILIGKPETACIELILDKHGISNRDAMIVGDNLDTDILAGHRAGITTAFVLTGIHSNEDLQNAPEDRIPDFILKDLSVFLSCLKSV